MARDARLDPAALPAAALQFLAARHLATLTTTRPDGTPHVTPVGFTWDDGRQLARVITGGASRKARHLASGGAVALCQVDGWAWLTLEGRARVLTDPDAVAEAERRYGERYRTPRTNPERVVIEIDVHRIMGMVEEPVRRPR